MKQNERDAIKRDLAKQREAGAADNADLFDDVDQGVKRAIEQLVKQLKQQTKREKVE